jgi:hypothetical protein
LEGRPDSRSAPPFFDHVAVADQVNDHDYVNKT